MSIKTSGPVNGLSSLPVVQHILSGPIRSKSVYITDDRSKSEYVTDDAHAQAGLRSGIVASCAPWSNQRWQKRRMRLASPPSPSAASLTLRGQPSHTMGSPSSRRISARSCASLTVISPRSPRVRAAAASVGNATFFSASGAAAGPRRAAYSSTSHAESAYPTMGALEAPLAWPACRLHLPP
ncbi:hypothetical protein T492DRAFT_217877 [Pavlovales sp. CCMP2436]|nr:hypothetical protein T492DRAFT_217877 [Pavlovales sp. CCMP2436]